MKLTIIYREKSEHARAVSEFVEMLRRRYPGKTAELVDIDTKEGADEAAIHGVNRYPAFLIKTYEGRLVQQWEGEPLPLLDEVGGMISDQPEPMRKKVVQPLTPKNPAKQKTAHKK